MRVLVSAQTSKSRLMCTEPLSRHRTLGRGPGALRSVGRWDVRTSVTGPLVPWAPLPGLGRGRLPARVARQGSLPGEFVTLPLAPASRACSALAAFRSCSQTKEATWMRCTSLKRAATTQARPSTPSHSYQCLTETWAMTRRSQRSGSRATTSSTIKQLLAGRTARGPSFKLFV